MTLQLYALRYVLQDPGKQLDNGEPTSDEAPAAEMLRQGAQMAISSHVYQLLHYLDIIFVVYNA